VRCEELFLTFLYNLKLCLPGTAHQTKEGRNRSLCSKLYTTTIRTRECGVSEIRDRMDRQDAVIATWHEGHPQRSHNT
jgi:hypothetical protein